MRSWSRNSPALGQNLLLTLAVVCTGIALVFILIAIISTVVTVPSVVFFGFFGGALFCLLFAAVALYITHRSK